MLLRFEFFFLDLSIHRTPLFFILSFSAVTNIYLQWLLICFTFFLLIFKEYPIRTCIIFIWSVKEARSLCRGGWQWLLLRFNITIKIEDLLWFSLCLNLWWWWWLRFSRFSNLDILFAIIKASNEAIHFEGFFLNFMGDIRAIGRQVNDMFPWVCNIWLTWVYINGTLSNILITIILENIIITDISSPF